MNPSQLQPGYRLDRYELLCPLAYGGMASVWLARFGGRLGFERMVVIKMILPQFSQDARFQEMFLDEARIASRIEHPNVARILDVGEDEESFFIVMEWVDGDSLSKILRGAEAQKEMVPAGVALRVIADAAAGLHAAHELRDRDGNPLGVVHRDVSPQNILVANNGATMIIDFGVAKARDRVSQDTSAGQLKGKIRYMAPEQALGKNMDRRADVWALGSMLYEMFSGQSPYEGPNEVATLHRLTSGAPIPPMPRSVPAVIREIVDRCLAHDPQDRFPSALELNLALENAMVEINEPTTPAIVAAYTASLLAERKASRKRAVDTALEAARARDVALPLSSKSVRSLEQPPSETRLAPYTPQNIRAVIPMHSDLPSSPSGQGASLPSLTGPHPYAMRETPSAGGSTLGSAAMGLTPMLPADDGPRKNKYAIAVGLGIAMACGVIGALAAFGPKVFRHDDSTAITVQQPLVVPLEQPTTPEPTPATTPSVIPVPVGTPIPDSAESASIGGAAGTVTPARTDASGGPKAGTTPTQHKPPPAAPTWKPKPPSAPPPTPKVDRGF